LSGGNVVVRIHGPNQTSFEMTLTPLLIAKDKIVFK